MTDYNTLIATYAAAQDDHAYECGQAGLHRARLFVAPTATERAVQAARLESGLVAQEIARRALEAAYTALALVTSRVPFPSMRSSSRHGQAVIDNAWGACEDLADVIHSQEIRLGGDPNPNLVSAWEAIRRSAEVVNRIELRRRASQI